MSKGTLTPRLVRDATSTDPVLFGDAQEGVSLLVERFAGKPSRLTVLDGNNKVKAEVAGLPANVWNLQRLPDGRLLAPGWDEGEIALVDTKTGKLARTNFRPDGLGAKEEDTHITGSLVDLKGNTWLVSSGISLKDFTPSEAKLHKLTSNFLSVEKSVAVPGCRNAYGPFVVFPGRSEAVLSCNPQYAGAEAAPENPVVQVRIVDEKPVFTKLVEGKNDGVQIYDVGHTGNGDVLISARATNSTADGWKGTFVSAARYSLRSQSAKPVDTLPVAGQAVRLPKSKATLTSCVVNPETSRCVPKLFGVLFDTPRDTSSNSSSSARPVTCTLRVDFKNDFAGFEQPLL
jgi:hypothetical protein